jgi:hypothetical protein
MNSSRTWMGVAVLLILALLAGTWFIGISPKLDEARIADEARAAVEAQNVVHNRTVLRLAELDSRLSELESEREGLRLAIPNTIDQTAFLRQVQELAGVNAVNVSSVTFSPPEAFVPAEDALVNPELAGPASTVTADNFYTVTVELSVTGPRGNVTAFLSSLQKGSRLFLAHDVVFPDGLVDLGSESAATITGQVFVLLDPSQVTAPPVAESTAVPPE